MYPSGRAKLQTLHATMTCHKLPSCWQKPGVIHNQVRLRLLKGADAAEGNGQAECNHFSLGLSNLQIARNSVKKVEGKELGP